MIINKKTKTSLDYFILTEFSFFFKISPFIFSSKSKHKFAISFKFLLQFFYSVHLAGCASSLFNDSSDLSREKKNVKFNYELRAS